MAGASAVAWVAGMVAKVAASLAQVAQVIQKTAQILTKLAEMFVRLKAAIMRIVKFLDEIKETLAASKALTKSAKGMDKIGAQVSFGIEKAVVSGGIAAVTLGTVKIPGTVGELYSGGKEYRQGWQHATDAKEAVEE